MRSRGDPDPMFGLKGLPSGVQSLGGARVGEYGGGAHVAGVLQILGCFRLHQSGPYRRTTLMSESGT